MQRANLCKETYLVIAVIRTLAAIIIVVIIIVVVVVVVVLLLLSFDFGFSDARRFSIACV